MAFCKKCGTKLNEGVKFCPKCGQTLDELYTSQSQDYQFQQQDVEFKREETDSDEYGNAWYKTDIFNVAIAPIVHSFDNGYFFLISAKVIIEIIIAGFLFSQPYLAYLVYKNNTLSSLSTADKTVELIFAIIMLILAVFSFGYWIKRIRKLYSFFNPHDNFVVIPLGTYLFQWVGEWIALMLSISGVFVIIISLADVKTSSLVLTLITNYGWLGGIIAIIASILIVFIFRLVAEEIRALATIANNTYHNQTIVPNVENVNGVNETNDMYINLMYAVCILTTVGFMLVAMFSK